MTRWKIRAIRAFWWTGCGVTGEQVRWRLLLLLLLLLCGGGGGSGGRCDFEVALRGRRGSGVRQTPCTGKLWVVVCDKVAGRSSTHGTKTKRGTLFVESRVG